MKNHFDSIESVVADLRRGKMVIVVDDADRENEGDLIMAGQHVTAAAVNFMAKHARGLVCVPTTSERLQQLGIERMVKQEKIHNAVILSGIGSVTGYQYHTVSNGTFPSKNIFVKNPTGPADITSVNGYIIDGRVHAHITFADPDKAFGGHLEAGTTVFTFAVVTVGVFKDGIDLSHIDDKGYR